MTHPTVHYDDLQIGSDQHLTLRAGVSTLKLCGLDGMVTSQANLEALAGGE